MCPRPSDDAVERSLTSRKSVVSCQFAKLRRLRDVELETRIKTLCFLARSEGCQALLFCNYHFPVGSRMGRILRSNSLRINSLTSNSFGCSILRGNSFPVSLLSIFCVLWGEGEYQPFASFCPRNGKDRRSRKD